LSVMSGVVGLMFSAAAAASASADERFEQVGDDIDGEAPGDRSGAVSLSADGSRLAIGAPGNDGGGEAAGQVRIFEWSSSTATWTQLGTDIDGPPGARSPHSGNA
jgi:hypothetical protein